MTVRFSKDEQAFIDGALNEHKIEEFLVQNIGNMEFNNRVYQELHTKQNEPDGTLMTRANFLRDDNLRLLERWTYQTPTAKEIKSIANKIKIAKQLQEQGIELLPEEKISLLELKQISRFSLLLGKKDQFRKGDKENKQAKDVFNSQSGDKPILEGKYNESTNKEFRELYENMVVCEQLAADLRKDILQSHTYKANDILIRNKAKSAVIENVSQKGITPLKEQTTVIMFDKNIDNNYINDAFEEDWIYEPSKNSFKIDKKSENLKQYESDLKSYQEKGKEINAIPTSSAAADVSKINVTDILSSDVYRLPKAKLNQTLMNQIQEEKDPKKLERLLLKHGAVKVQNRVAEGLVRTEDVKKSQTFNNLEDNLANTLETLVKSAKDQDEFMQQAAPRIKAYLAVSNTLAIQNFNQDLQNLYREHHKPGLKAKIIMFISSTLVSLGLKKSTAEKTIHTIGKFTQKLSDTREKTATQNKTMGH